MRTIPPSLATHLAEGTTSLCRCWRLIRRDGAVFGFTDHDRDLAFGGTTYVAQTGLEAAETQAELGFAVGGGEVAGALVSAGLTEADIAAGRYDDATVETWLVNWSAPGERILLDLGTIGEIRRADRAFVAELRGVMHRFDEERGRIFRATCSADLGDALCGVALASSSFTKAGSVSDTDAGLSLSAMTGLGFADGFCTGGRLTFTSGLNAGLVIDVKAHRVTGGVSTFDLWQRAPNLIAIGDGFSVTAGCDKRLATCRDRFANVVNFRGFPHMPGNDYLARTPSDGEAGFDGGSLFA